MGALLELVEGRFGALPLADAGEGHGDAPRGVDAYAAFTARVYSRGQQELLEQARDALRQRCKVALAAASTATEPRDGKRQRT